ncbi:hypothetical protein HS1genome_1765 [Sulfodiicoccus acidiphilus]|uniref:Uncharacterized protein n=1 Tax=Sulfodiicoccus acidiphilus TaxID=1670455 RepID=A0A348B5C4_9CREN|nr:hypothetical protein [Sulfodiicoccus acidiphilus]BBD73376.1 hypothetical protein HS1genome_1765 [Sulfodiicoccus acidiphilus]GGU00995.1 hypothetical protein GCM10007116_17850 [Sulfodiicoccus acidiphilus]
MDAVKRLCVFPDLSVVVRDECPPGVLFDLSARWGDALEVDARGKRLAYIYGGVKYEGKA